MTTQSPPDAPAPPEPNAQEAAPGHWRRRIVGDWNWQPPPWVPALRARAAAVPPQRWGAAVALLLVALLAAWLVFRDRPVPPGALAVRVFAPALTEYAKTPVVVHPLTLRFSGSAAPIKAVGGAPAGVTLEPVLAGAWTWSDDRTLVFKPDGDWPVGQQYTVHFDTGAVAPGVVLARDEVAFRSAPFRATLLSSEFYQDPLDARLKKGVYALGFSHPVDAATLEPRLALQLSDGAGRKLAAPAITPSYDEKRLKAWVHSAPLDLPENGGRLHLDVGKGVTSALGGPGSEAALKGVVVLPSLYSVAVDTVEATLVENERFEPEQVLVLGFNNAMRDTEVAAATQLWLLPERNPKRTDRNAPVPWPWAPHEVDAAVLKLSERLPATALPAEREYVEAHSLRFNAPPGRYVYARVEKGLKSFGGFLLGKPVARVQRVPDYPQVLRFVGDGALLSLSGERRISLVSRNVATARLEIGRVLPQQLQHLAFHNQGNYAQPSTWGIEEDSLVEREDLMLRLPAEDPAKAHYEGVDLGRFLAPGTRGIFLLSLRTIGGYEANLDPAQRIARNAGEQKDRRLVVLTDLGVLAKKALDGSRDVFVQSIANGRPVAGAIVRAVARNGETLVQVETDAEGRARLPDLDDFRREKQAVMLTVAREGDLSFLPLEDYGRRLDLSRFDVGGEPNPREAGTLSAFLFSDRGLYRPGDTLRIGFVVRAADWTRELGGLPLELVLSDPTGRVATRERIALDPSGFHEFSFTPSDAAPSGTWAAQLVLLGRDEERTPIGDTTVQVREFAPDTMRVRATLSASAPGGWVKPEKLAVTVLAENLFGTPAQQRRVEGTLLLRPAFPAFPAYPDYRFYDPQRAKDGVDEALGDRTTDAAGKAVFGVDLSKFARATYQMSFLARAFEPGSGRNVAAQATTLVSSNDFLVGIKAADGLEHIKRNAMRSVQLLAIGPDGKPRAVGGLQAVLLEKRFVSVLTKQDSGLYRYVSRERREPRKAFALAVPGGRATVALPTDQPGTYVLEVRDVRGTVLNQVEYSVAGAANLSRALDRNAELALTLSKKAYKPGEVIELSIRAPYPGSGLVTIERDKVYAHAWFRADTTSSVQRITVPADFEGNGYVNVQFLRDPGSDEVFMSPLSYGVAPFQVDRSARTQPVSLSLPKVVKPGALIPVDIRTEGKARVVVFAVDEGILQVARYKLGDPLDHFFARRMLQVQTAQILDLVLPEFARLRAMAAPGGDGEGDLSKNLNPFKRKAEAPAVWWSGIVEVDGSKRLTFRLPDHFNGRVRVNAVAVTANRIGTTEAALTVRGDFVLTPTLPTHVAPGDEFELPVGIANTVDGLRTPLAASASLVLPKGLTLVGAAPGAVRIAAGDETTVRFRLRAGEVLGALPVRIAVQSGQYTAQRRIELSVRPAAAFRQDLRAGRADQRIVLEKLRPMYQPLSTRRLAASASPLVAIDGLAAYLRDYPHLCTEQLLSQAIPGLVYHTRPELGHRVEGKVAPARLLEVLRARQNAEGGVGPWTAEIDGDAFVSAYTALYLVESRERGIAVPDDMLDSLNGFLETLAADRSRHDLPALRERAMAVYLLVRQGRQAGNQLAALQEQLERDQPKAWRRDATALFVAASYQRMQQAKAARLLAAPALARANAARPPAIGFAHYYDDAIEQAWDVYLLTREFPALARQLTPAALERLYAPLQGNRYNTLSAALTVLALDAYAGAQGNPPLATLQAAAATGPARQIGRPEGVVTAGAFRAGDSRLWVTPGNEAPVWYALTQNGFDRGPLPAAQSSGLEVVREYLDAAGKPVTALRLGEEVTVRLRVRSTTERAYRDIAITDLLPGGFEVVLQPPPKAPPRPAGDADTSAEDAGAAPSAGSRMPPLALPGATFQPRHAEVREDRVVLYGYAVPKVVEIRYRIRANNVGRFVVPPVLGESMYERAVFARGAPGGVLEVAAAR